MKKFTNQFNGSHADRINNGGGKFRRIALFPLMLFMLLLVPTSMMAQTDYDNTVTFTALAGNPQGFTNETYAKLFDGKKTKDKFSKWCCKFSSSANVIFAASKAGVPVGYTITTGDDNFTSKGRNPMSWKLYGNNVGKDGEWTLIQEVNNDTKLQDVNYTSYDFTCGGGKSYKYFKWEISAIHSGDVLQVGEFELKLQTCTHTNTDGSSALGDPIENVETTCTEHGYTTYNCSICHSTVKKYKTDELKKHTLTHHEATNVLKEHWQCDVCHKYFSDANATQEVNYASLLYPAYAEFDGSTGTLTFKCGLSKPEGVYDLNEGDSDPAWSNQSAKINKVVFDASFANARPTSCNKWFYNCNNLTKIEGIENLNTVNVTDMRFMFWGCSGLTSLDLSKFDTQKVTEMNGMFNGCSKLTLLNLSKFNTQNVTSMSNMFGGCSALTSLDLSKFDTQNVTNMEGIFDGCSGLTSLDLSKFDTQKVTNMRYMFNGCSALTSLDLSKFDTQKVPDMTNMFYGCSDLTTIYVSDKFVTTNVSFGYSMFEGCISLKGAIAYDASKIDHAYANYKTGYFTLKPSTAYAVFNEVDGTLTFRYDDSKPAGAYDLNEGDNMPAWRNQSAKINKVVFDVSFAKARPTSCYSWFYKCENLTKIEDIENLNTQNVTDMSYMFYGCDGLTSLDVSKFNTQKVENMHAMFSWCEGLNSLNLSNFDTQNVEYMNNMFWESSALATIYVSDKFVTTKVSYGTDMFSGCTSLKGATVYDASNTDHTYANYKTGYFTKLVGKNGNDKIGASGETLTAACLALDDEKDFVAYEPFTATTATYNREMKEGTIWATLCLPFEVSLADKNFRAFKLLSANESTSTIQLEEITTSIAAGTPVIIKMNNGETTLSISEANKEIAQKVVSAADGSYQLQGIYTQKVFDKDADNNCHIVKGDKLKNPTKLLENTSTTQVGSKPFRAYMVDNTSSSAGAKMFSIAIGDSTTAIDSLNTIADDNAIYYDLQGNRLSAPQKGINIVKRGSKTMKVIIK